MSQSESETIRLTGDSASCSTDCLCPVAVLFARADSIYKTLPRLDVWDADRDARNWPGGSTVVAHPPCGHWGRLRTFCTKPEEQRSLGPLSVRLVRQWGGVLEHPAGSKLWHDQNLPKPNQGKDKYGGWTLSAPQWWWGHPAFKATWLYIVGVKPCGIPPMPLRIGYPLYTVSTEQHSHATMHLRGLIGEMKKTERDVTPLAFALWLVELARRCKGHNDRGQARREET